ncbi:MAG: tyrosine-type recombinase/integrase [Alphaproteobacteria bacterium]|nr:tyrosine-type recombinase/integrase [Alphaproteobacteria bacterium]
MTRGATSLGNEGRGNEGRGNEEMAPIALRYVSQDRDRHGNLRTYLRRPGHPKQRLPDPKDPGFAAAYAKAMEGTAGPVKGNADPASLRWLLTRYYSSPEWKQLHDNTRLMRRRLLDAIPKAHEPFRLIRPRHIRKFRDAYADRPTTANQMLKALRHLFKWAVDRDLIEHSPAAEVRALTIRSDGFNPWSDEDIAAFMAHWPSGSRERLAFALLYYLAARRGDVITMGRQHYRAGRIKYRQQKTRQWVDVPVLPELERELQQVPKDQMTFLVTSYDKPFTPAGFGNWFREACRAAGLTDRSAHGLRKSMSEHLGEAGGSELEIASVTGHKTLAEVQRYTKGARRKLMASSAIGKLQAEKMSHPAQAVGQKGEITE